jgi:hypothetical protein
MSIILREVAASSNVTMRELELLKVLVPFTGVPVPSHGYIKLFEIGVSYAPFINYTFSIHGGSITWVAPVGTEPILHAPPRVEAKHCTWVIVFTDLIACKTFSLNHTNDLTCWKYLP